MGMNGDNMQQFGDAWWCNVHIHVFQDQQKILDCLTSWRSQGYPRAFLLGRYIEYEHTDGENDAQIINRNKFGFMRLTPDSDQFMYPNHGWLVSKDIKGLPIPGPVYGSQILHHLIGGSSRDLQGFNQSQVMPDLATVHSM